MFRKIYSHIWYGLMAAALAGAVFAFALWLPNFALIGDILFRSSASLSEKAFFLFSLLASIQTNFSSVAAGYTIAIAVLFGINSALFFYYVRSRRGAAPGSAALGVGGVVSGALGIGCAACGTFILSAVLGAAGTVGILAWLPFGGEEFGFIGVVLLLGSTVLLIKKIKQPLVCAENKVRYYL